MTRLVMALHNLTIPVSIKMTMKGGMHVMVYIFNHADLAVREEHEEL